jgi:putative addiction module antidote
MATAVKVTTIGNSVGIVLPKEVLNRLHIEKGDSLYVWKLQTESPSLRMTRTSPGRWKPQSGL